jgi:hypothetical protein
MKNVSILFACALVLLAPLSSFACGKNGGAGCHKEGASTESGKGCGCSSCDGAHGSGSDGSSCNCSKGNSGSCHEKEKDEPKAGCGADVSYKCAGQKVADGVSVAPGGKCTGDVDCCCWGNECLGNSTCCKKLRCKRK